MSPVAATGASWATPAAAASAPRYAFAFPYLTGSLHRFPGGDLGVMEFPDAESNRNPLPPGKTLAHSGCEFRATNPQKSAVWSLCTV